MMLALLIDIGWKSALISGVALVLNWLMRNRAAAERVFQLRVAITMLGMLPFAMLMLPALDLAVLPALPAPPTASQLALAHSVSALPAQPLPSPMLDGAMLATALYLIGAAMVLLHLAAGIATLARWTRCGVPVDDPQWKAAFDRAAVGLRRPVRLLSSRHAPTPLSWGLAPAWILIDAVSLERRQQADAVLAHEIAHVRRFDWPMLLATRIVVALLWFNPLVWLLAHLLARQVEAAADETAVRNVPRIDYAEALLAFASAASGHRAAVGMAVWPNAIRERITSIVDGRSHRRSSRRLLTAVLAFSAAGTPLLAATKFVRAAPAEAPKPFAMQSIAQGEPVVAPRARFGRPAAKMPGQTAATASATGAAPAAALPTPANAWPAQPVVVARPLPVPGPEPQRQIVGQAGAQVASGPDGTSTAAAPAPPAPVATQADGERSQPEGRMSAARGLREAAAELHRQADEMERKAADPDQFEEGRTGYLKGAEDMRRGAKELEAEANKLTGG